MNAPQITVNGSTVIWQQGGTRTRHSLGSHDEALTKAAELEQEWEDEQRARRALYEAERDAGVDVVLYPEDAGSAAPEPEPEPEPQDEPVDEPELEIDVELDWDDETNRVAVSITSNLDVTVWRSIGGRTSTFNVTADQPLARTFKAVDGDDLFLRLDDEHGPEIAFTTFVG